MLEIENLHAAYAKREVLHGVSLKAPAGAVTVLLGPNGCGKSTLLKSLCGIVPAAGAKVLLDDCDLLKLPQKQLAQRVAYLAQNRQLPDMTVERLILHGRFPYLDYPRRYRKEDHQIVRQAMEQMDLLDLAGCPIGKLSGGQQQKAFIAMALAQDTDVILLDEPTTYLDVTYQLQFLRHARMLADSGKHVLMVLHDLPLALEAADWTVLMADGKTILQGPPEGLYRSGALEQVFGISITRTSACGRWRYFVQEKRAKEALNGVDA